MKRFSLLTLTFSTFVKLYLLPNLERPILISKLISVLLSVRFYSFFFIRFSMNIKGFDASLHLVGTSGLEPPTSRLSGARSNHLSYAPLWLLVASSPSCLPLAALDPRVISVRYALWSLELARHGQWPGGDDGNRTHDPLLAGQVLSQLSYTPMIGYSVDHQSLKIEQQAVRISLQELLVFCLNSTLNTIHP